MLNAQEIIDIGQQMLLKESEALSQISHLLSENGFMEAVGLILNCQGSIVICSSGKCEYIGNKIANTLSSAGARSYFLYSSEAEHTMQTITNKDMILFLSHSGENNEILSLAQDFEQKEIKIISITSYQNSTLAQKSNVNIKIAIDNGSGPYNTAPIIIHSVMLGIGDAIAMIIMESKGIKKHNQLKASLNFDKLLNTKIYDVMIQDTEIPKISPYSSVKQAINIMNAKKLGRCITLT